MAIFLTPTYTTPTNCLFYLRGESNIGTTGPTGPTGSFGQNESLTSLTANATNGYIATPYLYGNNDAGGGHTDLFITAPNTLHLTAISTTASGALNVGQNAFVGGSLAVQGNLSVGTISTSVITFPNATTTSGLSILNLSTVNGVPFVNGGGGGTNTFQQLYTSSFNTSTIVCDQNATGIFTNSIQSAVPSGAGLTVGTAGSANILLKNTTASIVNSDLKCTSTINTHYLGTSSIQVNGYLGSGYYSDSHVDTNFFMGAEANLTAPDFKIFPTTFGVGSLGTGARSIGMYAGGVPAVPGGGITIATSGDANLTCAGTLNLNGAGIVNVSAVGGIEVTALAGVAVSGGGGVAITGGGTVVVTGGLGVEIFAGAGIAIGTAGVSGGGVTSYGGNFNVHQGIGGENGYVNAYSGVNTSSIMCSTIGTDIANISSANISSITTANGAFFVSGINNSNAVSGLSTLQYDPTSKQIFYTDMAGGGGNTFQNLFTSSLQVSSMVIGNSTDADTTKNTMVLYGGTPSDSGIYMSSIGTGIGPGLYTSLIASTRGIDDLDIGDVRTIQNYAVTMAISGLSSINANPYHSGVVGDPYNSFYSSNINTSQINTSSISCSTLTTFNSGGYISTALLNTSNIINMNLYTSTISTFNINFLNSNVLLGVNNYPPPGGVSGAIAVGNNAMALGNSQICIGTNAGSNVAHAGYHDSISIGTNAGIGINGTGSNSIFIGTNATQPGYGASANNTIFINASGTAPTGRLPREGTFIMPINNNSTVNSSYLMYYDKTYGELSYGAPAFDTLGVSSLSVSSMNAGTIGVSSFSVSSMNAGTIGVSSFSVSSMDADTIGVSSLSVSSMNAGAIGVSSFSVSSMNNYSFYAPTTCYFSTSVAGVYSPDIGGYKYLTMNLPTPIPNPLPAGIGYLITGNLNTESQTGGSGGDWSSYIKVNDNMIGVSTIMTDEGTLYGNPGSHVAISVQALFSTTEATTYPLAVDLWFQGGVGATTGDMGLVGGTLTVLANV